MLGAWRRESAAAVLLSVGGLLLGCSGSGDTTDPVSLSPTQLFWAVQLDKHAVNLALTPPRLTATVRAHDAHSQCGGEPLTGSDRSGPLQLSRFQRDGGFDRATVRLIT